MVTTHADGACRRPKAVGSPARNAGGSSHRRSRLGLHASVPRAARRAAQQPTHDVGQGPFAAGFPPGPAQHAARWVGARGAVTGEKCLAVVTQDSANRDCAYCRQAFLKWAPDPAQALQWALELNHRYALDGADPCSCVQNPPLPTPIVPLPLCAIARLCVTRRRFGQFSRQESA